MVCTSDHRSATLPVPALPTVGVPLFTPVRTRKTFEAVAQIADEIALGGLRVGDRLPSERVVAEQMGISRPTLREAVGVLVKAGVLAVRPGATGGMFVTSDVVPRDVVQRTSQLRLGEVGGVLEARRLFEPRVAQLASVHASAEELDGLAHTIEAQRGLLGPDGRMPQSAEDRFLALDLRFHLGIARATGNATVLSLMRSLLRELEIARDMTLHEPLAPGWSVEVHERTLAAIRGGDLDEIEAVMDEHLGGLESTWERESTVRPVPAFLRPRRTGPPAGT